MSDKVNNITKEYPEFGFKVWYNGINDTDIEWEVHDMDDNMLMTGVFYSKDFFQSTFNIIPARLKENIYESLFYLYFENIKLECITLVEDEDVEVEDEEIF